MSYLERVIAKVIPFKDGLHINREGGPAGPLDIEKARDWEITWEKGRAILLQTPRVNKPTGEDMPEKTSFRPELDWDRGGSNTGTLPSDPSGAIDKLRYMPKDTRITEENLSLSFIARVKAAYTLKERLQTFKKSKSKIGVASLVGYSTPSDSWLTSISKTMAILKAHDIKASIPTTKSSHISVCVVQRLNEAERDAIREFAKKEARPQFTVIGLELLSGQEKVDYLTIAYNIPDEHKRLFAFIRNLCGADRISDYRTWFKDHKPHASLVTVPKDVNIKKIIPEIWEAVKGELRSFKPEYIEFFDKMELSEFYEITQSYDKAINGHFYKSE